METHGDCSICLTKLCFELDIADCIIKTECNHVYHYKCWKKHWEQDNDLKAQCPLCRERLGYEGEKINDKEYIELLEEHCAFPVQ